MPHLRQPPTILATCCVPWKEDFSFAEDIFRRSVRLLAENLTPDLYVFGTAGEGYAVTDAQFAQVCRAFWAETHRAGARPMVGAISLSLGTIIERIAGARDMGFRRFQISLPSWGALNDTELRRFFAEVCGRFTDCEFLHYNLLRTKRLVTAAEYAELAARHPNLVATKHGTDSPAMVETLLRQATGLTHFITEKGFAHAALLGSCGLLISVGSMNFATGQALFAAGGRQDAAALARFAAEASTIVEILLKHAQSVTHMDGAYDKLFCRVHDPDFPLRLLPPYSAITDSMFESIAREIGKRTPSWLPN